MELYNKYRPQEMAAIVGNKPTVKAIEAALLRDEGKIPHAFLLTGPSGCGKTTLAYIMADMLGCDMENDFRDMDSAHYGGVDSIRELRTNMTRASLSGGTCRVWLIDECHKLSTDAQNALLKALEKPPSHVYFILATTDPQKLIKTVKTRCMTFDVKPLDDEQMSNLIGAVATQEERRIPEKVIDSIVASSLGSPRMGLVLLDSIIHMHKRDMLEAVVKTAEQENETIELINALLWGKVNWPKIAGIIKGLDQEPESIRRAILGYCSAVLLNNKNSDRMYQIMRAFEYNYFDTGKPGLVMSCFDVWKGK